MRFLVVAAVLASSTVTTAEPAPTTEQIVAVGIDPQLTDALGDALAPAGIIVLRGAEVGTPSLAELPTRSREIADRAQASATIWLVPAGAGTTLVTYDRAADRMLVRELPYQSPLSGTQAAEAARIVRTMLRALRETSEIDRAPPAPPPPPPPPAPREPQLAASLGAGVWIAGPAADGALAGTLSVAWRPHGLGVAVVSAIAPSADVMTATFSGRVRDVELAAEVRNAIVVAPHWRLSPGFGAAVHAIRLAGSFATGGDLVSRRYDPALRVGLTLGYELPTIEVGLTVSADCLLRRQRYERGSEEILVVPRVQGMTGVVVGIRL